MATTPVQIAIAVSGVGASDLAASDGDKLSVVSLDFCNTTTADITLDVWFEPAGGGTNIMLFDDVVVPAKGTLSWRGSIVLDANTEKIQAQGSAAGIDCLGAAYEYA